MTETTNIDPTIASSEDEKKKFREQIDHLLETTRQTLPSVKLSLVKATDVQPLLNYLETVTASEIINTQGTGYLVFFVKSVSALAMGMSAEGVTEQQKAYQFCELINRIRVLSMVSRKTTVIIDGNERLTAALLEMAVAYFALFNAIDPSAPTTQAVTFALDKNLSAFQRLWDHTYPEHSVAATFSEQEEATADEPVAE